MLSKKTLCAMALAAAASASPPAFADNPTYVLGVPAAPTMYISSDAAEGGGWLLRIANDGTPFDPESAPGAKDGHFGLEGMRQRARRLGATVSFARRKAGMVVELSHPASAR